MQHNNPMYLRDLLTTYNPSRNLRSSSHHLLSVGYMRTVSSSRCFKHSATINWNDLPFEIVSHNILIERTCVFAFAETAKKLLCAVDCYIYCNKIIKQSQCFIALS